jgi:hypothetical protein
VNRFLLAIILLFVCAFDVRAESERIWVNAKINGKPVRFILDTGLDTSAVLFSATAQRLGLKITPPDPNEHIEPGEVPLGTTEVCNLDLGTTNIKTSLSVMEMPAFLPFSDGMFGWPLISQRIVHIDAANNIAEDFQNVPSDPIWVQLRLWTNSDYLCLEIPDKKGAKAILSVDTGSPDGIRLAPPTWRNWKAAHTNSPITLSSYFTPALGLVIREESWAKSISLGPLTLTDVPIMEADSNNVRMGSFSNAQYQATLGLVALKRLDVIIDGKNGIAYLRPQKTPSLHFEHNRLGAVFVPKDLQSDDLIAHVVDGSPACEAGIRDGDVLLEIDGRDITKWRTGKKPNTPFREQPAGTKFELTLKRGDNVFKATVMLRNILPPDAPKNLN